MDIMTRAGTVLVLLLGLGMPTPAAAQAEAPRLRPSFGGAIDAPQDGPAPGATLPPPAAGPTAGQPQSPAQQAEIVWRVQNPFRLFTDPADTEQHRLAYAALEPSLRSAPISAAERLLGRRLPHGWSESVFRKTCWNAERNRYECREEPDYVHPRSHKVVVEIQGFVGADERCSWLTTPHGGRIRGQAVQAPCGRQVVLDIPYPGGSRVTVGVADQPLAEQDIVVRDLFIVGLGDSFASGEGNPDVPVRFDRERSADYGRPPSNVELFGFPARRGGWKEIGDQAFIGENARWLDTACHRSLYSHQLRTALQLAVEDPHRAVTFVSFACAGAEVIQGLFLTYKGHEWVSNPPSLSQISAAAQAQCGRRQPQRNNFPDAYHLGDRLPELKDVVIDKCERQHARRIDLLLLSIGGNDVGFSRVVASAVLADESNLKWIGGWMGSVYNPAELPRLLHELEDRYKALKRALHNILHIPWEEADRIVLTGYPPMAMLEDGRSVCADGQAGMDVFPQFELSEAKARDGEVVAERLNLFMREAARAHGWTLVDGHRRAFVGRGICAGAGSQPVGLADELAFPRKLGEDWVPYNPALYQPYAPRARWFRTPNDAFLTGHFHVAQSIAQKVLKLKSLSWVQLLLAATYSGAFHPTAEGQAVMADAVAERARLVLLKYSREGYGPTR